MKEIKDAIFPLERALYGSTDLKLINCKFDGVEDGESALKEASNIILDGCYMNLRYPLWHDDSVLIKGVEMTPNCRAALWYSSGITIEDSKLLGIKALRECHDITIDNTTVVSPEFGWKSSDIAIQNSDIESEYLLFLSKNITLNNVKFKGKYSFQYVENMTITNSQLDTKDAFWHTKNVTVKDSLVKGEYLAWYSENLTLINCHIVGTQPFCYCKNLKLVNCTMEKTDFSFEYSDVEADIKGNILSIKNPASGKIVVDSVDELIYTDDSKYKCDCQIVIRGHEDEK